MDSSSNILDTMSSMGDITSMSSDTLPTPEMRRAIRRAAGRSMAELAAELHVSRQSISFWERGLVEPTGEHLTGYGDLLGRLRVQAAEILATAEAS